MRWLLVGTLIMGYMGHYFYCPRVRKEYPFINNKENGPYIQYCANKAGIRSISLLGWSFHKAGSDWDSRQRPSQIRSAQ